MDTTPNAFPDGPDGPGSGLPDDPLKSFDPLKTQQQAGRLDPAQSIPEIPNTSLAHWSLSTGSAEADILPPPDVSPASASAFRLQRKIAQGGFGEVWEAVQESLHRHVAIKRLRRDLLEASRGDAHGLRLHEAAFRQEALTAATLDHPNIVPIHDLGLDEDGTPLLAMKLVRGRSWHEALWDDYFAMDFDAYLARHLPILASVAQAVAFAHSRGIVHRDVKPSQVMVGAYGEVLLMDWGLALVFDPGALAALGQTTTAHIAPTCHTATSPAGTVAFMAPEQTDPTAARIGPWTDVYLLGATLYFILTRTPPHNGADTRVAFLQARSGEIEHPRERAANVELPEELAALCVHALDAEPTKRPPDAQAFLTLLRDYLSGEGRRREAVTLLDRVEAQIDHAGASYEALAECQTLVDRAGRLWPRQPRCEPLARRVAEAFALAALSQDDLRLARLQAERLGAGEARTDLIERITRREGRLRRVHRQRRQLFGATLVLLAGVAALATWGLSRARAETHERERAEAARNRARDLIYVMLNDFSDQLRAIQRLDVMQKVADQALEYYRDDPEQDTSRAAVAQRVQALWNIGDVFISNGRMEDGAEAYIQARRIAEEQLPPDDVGSRSFFVGLSRLRVGLGYARTGRMDEALTEMLAAAPHLEKLYATDPSTSSCQAAMEVNLHLGTIYQTKLDYVKAREHLVRGLEISEKELTREPDSTLWLRQVVRNLLSVGSLELNQREIEQSAKRFARSRMLAERALELEPGNVVVRSYLATSLQRLGSAQADMGDRDASIDLMEQAAEITAAIVRENPDSYIYRRELSLISGSLCTRLADVGRIEDARRWGQQAVELREMLMEGQSDPAESTLLYADGLMDLAYVDQMVDDVEGALELYRRAADRMEAVARERTGMERLGALLVKCRTVQADCELLLGLEDDAATSLRKAREFSAALTGATGDVRDVVVDGAILRILEGELALDAGREEAARAAWNEGAEALRPVEADAPSASEREWLAVAEYRLGNMAEAQRLHDLVAEETTPTLRLRRLLAGE